MLRKKLIDYQIRSPDDQFLKRGTIQVNINQNIESLMEKIQKQHGLATNTLTLEQPHTHLLDDNTKIVKFREGKIRSRIRKLSEQGSVTYEYASIIEQQASHQFMYHEPEIPLKVIGHVRWCYKFFPCCSSTRTMVLNFQAIRFYKHEQTINTKSQKQINLQDVSQISSYRKKNIYFLRILTINKQRIDLKFNSKQICKEWVEYFNKAINYHNYLSEKKTYCRTESYKDIVKTLLENDKNKTIKLEQNREGSSENTLAIPKNNEQTDTILKNSMKNAIKLADFKITHQIGRGAFSTVYQAEREGKTYAMKQIKKDDLIRRNQIKYAVTELAILKKCSKKCDFIIPLHYAFQTQDYLYLVLKYLNYGTLKDIVQKRKCLTRKQSFNILCELVIAIEFLHKNKILYRDMKPENILLTKQGHIYLIDFGLSIQLGEQQQFAQSFVGTPLYLAPERLQGSGRVNTKADIYGVGCIYYFMLHGHAPFQADSFDCIVHRIRSTEFEIRQDVDELTNQFLKQTIEPNVHKRLSHMSTHLLFEKIDWGRVRKKDMKIMQLQEIVVNNFCDSVGDMDYNEENFPNKKINDWIYVGGQ